MKPHVTKLRDCARSGFSFLSALALALSLSSCEKHDSADLSQLSQRLEDINFELRTLQRQNSDLRSSLAQTKTQIENLDTDLALARKESDSSRSELQAAYDGFVAYRGEYRRHIRSVAKGMKFEKLSAGPEDFRNVVIKDLQDEVVTFTHALGVGRIYTAELSEDMRNLFAIDSSVVRPEGSGEIASQSVYANAPTSYSSPISSLMANAPPPPPRGGSRPPTAPLSTASGTYYGSVMRSGGPAGYKPIGSSFTGSYYNRNTPPSSMGPGSSLGGLTSARGRPQRSSGST